METPYKSFTKKSTDYSVKKGFSFGFFCDHCGKERVSPLQPFSGGNREDAHYTAFIEASAEAKLYFNNCPKCGAWVCDNCFSPEADFCKECNKK